MTIEIELNRIKEYEAVVKVDDRVVSYGFLIVHPHRIGKPHGIIEEIFTEPEHRNKGYATQIISQLIAIAKTEECYKIVLECGDHNVHLYARHGFKKHQNSMRLSL